MRIKVIKESGRSRVLRVYSFETMRKIADRFNRWEYK